MKKAGSKNDGAWFRTNKVLVKLDGAQRAVLAGKILASDYVDNAYISLTSLAAETGVDAAISVPSTKALWVATLLARGIPRQVWNGRLTYSTYSKNDDGKWVKNYESGFHYFAKDLRKICRNYILALREVADLVDKVGGKPKNPGGLPDADRYSALDTAT